MSKRLTVGDLMKTLHGVPPSTEVLIPTGDHTFMPATVKITTALRDGPDRYEDQGEESTPEMTWGTRIDVVVIE